ncbi:MAG: M23 family metallopeptidase [bacterium]
MRIRKGFTIIIVPHSGRRNKEIIVSGVNFLLFFVLVVFAILGNYLFFRLGFGSLRNEYIEYENKKMRKELVELEEELKGLRSSFAMVYEKNRKIASILEIDAPSNGLGVGGAQLETKGVELDNRVSLLKAIDSLKVALFVEKRLLEDSYRELASRQELIRFTPTIKPVKGYLTAGFGMRIDPFTGELKPHLGVDLSAPKGTPVIASADGIVKFAGFYHGYGKLVIINHGKIYETWYGHLNSINVSIGQKIKRGEKIGTVGSTGLATGTHLHYEVRAGGRPQNPLNYFYPDLVVD